MAQFSMEIMRLTGSLLRGNQQIAEREQRIDALETERIRLEREREVERDQRQKSMVMLVNYVNRISRIFDIFIRSIVLFIGMALVSNLFFNYVEIYFSFGSYVLAAIGAFGIIQSVLEFFGRPVWTARKLSSIFTSRLVDREISRRGLVWLSASEIEISGGKATVPVTKPASHNIAYDSSAD